MAAAALSLPLNRIASNQGSIAIKEHQRNKRRASSSASSSSPPSIASLTSGTRFAPTTIGSKISPSGAVGVGRPLDASLVAATVTVRTSPSSPTKSLPPTFDDDDTVNVVVVKGQNNVGWLKSIIPDKLVHYDPSKDPRLHSL